MFWFKRSKIVVDAFTYHSGVLAKYPITAANRHHPQWWKDIPKSLMMRGSKGLEIPVPTMRTCDGFIKYYARGLIVPMWSDLLIHTSQEGKTRYQYSANEYMPQIDLHTEPSITKEHVAMKIMSPWLLSEKSGVEFLLTNPMWNNMMRGYMVQTTPGIINFKHQNTINMNVLVDKSKYNEISYTAGEPVMHLIPLSEKDVEVRCHKLSKEEYDDMYLQQMYRSTFVNTYAKHKKCPFHANAV